ncbi:hypothetical protein TNCV_4300671 [Trichonephila clavipes]|nr:hypothetical protein TNCV_4300671 [Trichonephila clavipes]
MLLPDIFSESERLEFRTLCPLTVLAIMSHAYHPYLGLDLTPYTIITHLVERRDHGSLVIKVSDRGWPVTSSSPVPLKTCRVGEQCMLHMSSAQMSSRWCDVVVRREGC